MKRIEKIFFAAFFNLLHGLIVATPQRIPCPFHARKGKD